MSTHHLKLKYTLAAAPATTRAVPIRLDACGDQLAYGSGHTVVVRSFTVPGEVLVCTLHRAPVTAVRFAPGGQRIASGDQNGTIIIWANKAGTNEIYNSRELQGPVRDIAWTGDGERLIVVGEGKSMFAVAITTTGNTVGMIDGHSRNILSCDARHERPFKAVTGSADSLVGFYDGVPFKFKCNVPAHVNSVTCVRYAPNGAEVASSSSAPALLVMDGTTGERKRSIETKHTGTVYGLAWSPDGSRIATASADKTVHVLDAAAGTLLHTISMGKAVPDMQQGIVYTKHGVVCAALSGTLNLIDDQQGCIKATYHGHQGRVLLLHVDAQGVLLSLSTEGRLLAWPTAGEGLATARDVPLPSDCVISAAVQGDAVYVVVGEDLVRYRSSEAAVTVVSHAAQGAPVLAVTEDGHVVLVHKTRLVLLSAGGDRQQEVAAPKLQACCAAAQSQLVAVGGERVLQLYRVGATLELVRTWDGDYTSTVCSVCFSRKGDRVASGDGAHRIMVYDIASGLSLYSNLSYHTLSVTSLAFDPTGYFLISGSTDCALILWDLEAATRKMEDGAHRGGVSAVVWGPQGQLLSAGGDNCIRSWVQ